MENEVTDLEKAQAHILKTLLQTMIADEIHDLAIAYGRLADTVVNTRQLEEGEDNS